MSKKIKKPEEEKIFGKYASVSEKDIRMNMVRGGRGGGGPRGPMSGRLFSEKPKNTKGTIKRLLGYLGKNKAYLIILFVIMIFTSIFSLISPVLQGKAIDSIPLKKQLSLELNSNGQLLVNDTIFSDEPIISASDYLKIQFNSTKIGLSSDNKWIINDNETDIVAYDSEKTEVSKIKVESNGILSIDGENTEIKIFQTSENIDVDLNISVADSGKWNINGTIIKEYAIGSLNPNMLFYIVSIMALVYVCNIVFTFVSSIVSAYLSESTIRKLRKDLFDNLIFLPIGYFDNHQHGDIMSRMSNDASIISNTISQSISSIISSILIVLGAIGIMLYYSPLLTLTCFVTLGMTLLATKILSKYMKKYYRIERSLVGEINAQVEEMVVGHKTVKAFCKEDDVEIEFNKTSRYLRKYGFKANLFGGVMGPVMNIINNIGYLLVVVFGALFVQYGIGRGITGTALTIGSIITFTNLSKQFSRPINTIANLYAQIQTSLAAAERVFTTMDEKHEVNEGKVLMNEIKNVGLISFENVDFSYVENEKVLKDFSLNIEPGQKIALVGATGSGKTTIVNLLMRFYNIDSGSIKIGGVDIRDIDINSLRSNIAIVLQDTVLFKDTVQNNIRYGKLNASDEEVKNSAVVSNSDSFIMRLPNQYETMLTESGSNISGGQRQLLSISRAVLASPKILILDEATSSVDTRTEKNIQDGLVELMKNRTSVIIAHRLSTIRDADKIVVIDHGHIVEVGKHEELLNKKGVYYNLYQTQFAGNSI